MINIEFDAKKRKAVLSGDKTDVELVREHFSVPNLAAKFGRGRWNMPKRLYAITPAGYMDVGLVSEVLTYIDVMGEVKVTTSDAVLDQLTPAMDVEHVATLSKHMLAVRSWSVSVGHRCRQNLDHRHSDRVSVSCSSKSKHIQMFGDCARSWFGQSNTLRLCGVRGIL